MLKLSGLGLTTLPKETVQPALDTFTGTLTRNLPMGIHADSVQITDDGVTAKFITRNATIPTGQQDPCFSGVLSPAGLHPSSSMVLSSTTGRHGSRFQLAFPGSANSASRQWQTNCDRIPGVSASGPAQEPRSRPRRSAPASCPADRRPSGPMQSDRPGGWPGRRRRPTACSR